MLSSSPQYQVATGYLTNLYVAQIERSHHPLPAMLHPRGSNKGIQEPMIVNAQKFRHKDTKTYQPIPGIPVLDWMMSPHMRGVRAFCILLQPTHTHSKGEFCQDLSVSLLAPLLYQFIIIYPSTHLDAAIKWTATRSLLPLPKNIISYSHIQIVIFGTCFMSCLVEMLWETNLLEPRKNV